MEDLVSQLLERAGRSDEEDWIQCCLQNGPAVAVGSDAAGEEVASQAGAEAEEAPPEEDDAARGRRSVKRQRRSFSPSEFDGGAAERSGTIRG